MHVYLETGKKRTFACAIEWPGWARSGPGESEALQALLDYAPRYEAVLADTQLGFASPSDASAFAVVERVEGNATTDFGAPDVSISSDTAPVTETELERLAVLLQAYWRKFDQVVEEASGQALRKGPRGGGRELDKIVTHLLESDQAYLAQIGWKRVKVKSEAPRDALARTREAVIETLTSVARDGVPPSPRGGKRWLPRYFVRRLGWHVLDHAWEIEDRS
jgi:hypothetical protein